jgi:hypothetical protein
MESGLENPSFYCKKYQDSLDALYLKFFQVKQEHFHVWGSKSVTMLL